MSPAKVHVTVPDLAGVQRDLISGVFADDGKSATVEDKPNPFGDKERVNVLLLGGANGAHTGGKNVTLREHTPLANLHLTILDRLGIRQPSFGNSSGLLAEV